MGYWPRKMKVRRHSFGRLLGHKLILLGCQHACIKHTMLHGTKRDKRKRPHGQSHYLTHPSIAHLPNGAGVAPGEQMYGSSYVNIMVKGGHMMGIL